MSRMGTLETAPPDPRASNVAPRMRSQGLAPPAPPRAAFLLRVPGALEQSRAERYADPDEQNAHGDHHDEQQRTE
jgi:hypothetical protein